LADCRTVGMTVTCFLLLRYLASQIFEPVGDWILPMKKKWTQGDRRTRVSRFAICVFKLSYFVVISSWGFYMLKRESWTPSMLGGSGDIANVGGPNIREHKLTAEWRVYYLTQLSYHVQSFIMQFTLRHRSDFMEMALHHMCTIFLIGFSYTANYWRIGTLVFFAHDFSDISSYLIKAVVDTDYIPVIIPVFFFLLASWGYMRLYMFPFYILRAGFVHIPMDLPATNLLRIFLCVLQCLHVYWYSLFIYMGFMLAKGKEAEDIQENLYDKNAELTEEQKDDLLKSDNDSSSKPKTD